MAAYFILDTEVQDPAGYAQYVKAGSPSVQQYGGKYIARGVKVEVLEGDWQPHRIVVIEFPSFDQAKRWYNSPEYQAALSGRLRSAVSKAIIIEGCNPYNQ
jgi:uncharacterized protein (DUF1330 family)